MKVIKLNVYKPMGGTEKLLRAILQKDLNAFKATSKIHPQQPGLYYSGFSGMIA